MGSVLKALGAHEFDFTASDFERVRALLYSRTGISIGEQKRDMVYSRLARRLRHHGIDRFSTYLDSLEILDEEQAFINALTTNLTSFFREAHHFQILHEDVLAANRPPAYRVWSAAASTGEEPYSIAMTLAEAYGIAAPPVSVVASDVDTDVLEIARRGVYPLARVKDLSRSYLRSYFRRGTGSNAGLARVSPPIAALVEFQQINLLDHRWSLHGMFDAIFCRNVLIYFDRLGQDRVLDRLTRHLKEGGLLMLGHSESIRNPRAHFTPLGRTAYRKSTATGSAP